MFRSGETQPFTGAAVGRYQGGEIAIANVFQDGKRHGIEVEWLKDGTKKRETRYHEGEAVFQKIWRSDGSKKIETGLKKGVAHGPHKRWHPNGRLGWVGEFYEGNFHGLVEDRDENGVLILKGRFDKGKLVEDLMPKGSAKPQGR